MGTLRKGTQTTNQKRSETVRVTVFQLAYDSSTWKNWPRDVIWKRVKAVLGKNGVLPIIWERKGKQVASGLKVGAKSPSGTYIVLYDGHYERGREGAVVSAKRLR